MKETNTIRVLLEHPETECSEEVLICYSWFYYPGSPPSWIDPYGEPGGYEFTVNSWQGPSWVTEDLVLAYLYNTDIGYLI